MLKRVTLILATFLLFATGSLWAATVLTITPSGDISGAPGQTVGWGFTLSNDADFLLVTGAFYDTATPVGAFTDFASTFNFIVVGPSPESTSVPQDFDLTLHTGVGSYAIDSGAVPGALSTGTLRVVYDLYPVSPNDGAFNPDTDLISTGNTLQSAASVEVSVSSSSVPEPSATLLVSLGLFVGCVARRRR